jgi:glycine/D-amino acid oxidase-like deaminating enzyme
MADATYDLIIIGGGAIGLSTAYHAGKRGMRTLGSGPIKSLDAGLSS